MFKKDKILNYLRNPEDKSTVARVIEKIEAVDKGHEPQVLDFYDPYQRNLINSVLPANLKVKIFWAGGYESAERQRLIILPFYMDSDDVEVGIFILRIYGNLKFQQLSHRDYLGAILGLGIKREKVGDLLPVDDGCQVIVDKDISSYIEMNLDKIHRVKVKVEPIKATDLILPEESVKELKATVSSMRLDAICSAGFGTSRSEVVKDISSEKVKLNWEICNDTDRKVQENDIISIRGKGRIKVEEVKGETKKGRILINIKKFI